MYDIAPLPLLSSQTLVDIAGRPLFVGQVVAFIEGETHRIGVLQRIHPRRVNVVVPVDRLVTGKDWEERYPVWPATVVGVEVGMDPAEVDRLQDESKTFLDFTEPSDQKFTKRYVACTLGAASKAYNLKSTYDVDTQIAVLEVYGSTAADWQETFEHFQATVMKPNGLEIVEVLNITGGKGRAYTSWHSRNRTVNQLWAHPHQLKLTDYLHSFKRLGEVGLQKYVNKVMTVTEYNSIVMTDFQVTF